MKPRAALLALLLAGGCDLVPERLVEQGYDPDGDGVAWPEDCDSTDPSRSSGAAEIWYDGVDQDCGLDDDYDRDGDGWIPSVYVGLPTAGVEGSGLLPGGDCWDDPESQGEDLTVIPDTLADAAGQPLAWAQPSAAQVHPGATEVFYDGVDQDCDGQDDLDQDGDGWRTSAYPDRGGFFGDDCIDGAPLDEPNPAAISPDEANPGAAETFYDGTDQDCDTEDCDQDGDGQPADPHGLGFCTQQDCDDRDPGIGSGADFEEVWYDGLDQDCDGDDGDQDGDGYWVADYLERVAAAGGAPLLIPAGMEGDCWDVPAEVEAIPTDLVALNGYPQPPAAEVFPGAEDPVYDGIDQDCAANGDFDLDQDGAAADSVPDRAGEVGDDCDDEDPNINPWALEIWYDGRDPNCDDNDGDQDGDGFWAEDYEARVAASGGSPMAVPSGYEGDCDDLDRGVYPSADEWCDGIDSDCDGLVDEQALDAATWYTDADADGYGDAATATITCTQPSGTVADATDCDDTDAGVNPGALEVCDHVDDDCDGLIDQLDPSVADALTWYADADGDSYGDAADPGALWCAGDEPAGSLLSATDCDDTDAGVNPAAVEVCDHVDNDCDGSADDPDAADAGTWYADADADGWGDPAVATVECWQPTGTVADASDCDDSAASVYPGAAERVGNGVDEDCDGQELCFEDLDGDAWGGEVVVTSADLDCGGPGEAWDNGDCDEADAGVSPTATEVAADGLDQDCDGTELCYQDNDGDAFGSIFAVLSTDLACGAAGSSPFATDCADGDASVYPGADEGVADGVDQDCDGQELCWEDADIDGIGAELEIPSPDLTCGASGVAVTSGDCDDADAAISPVLPEVTADGRDNDCDGSEACYADIDLDGYGTGAIVASADFVCTDAGESSVDTDCDDADAAVNPAATEVCGSADEDCDGLVDDDDPGVLGTATWYADLDADGYGDASSAVSACAEPSGFVSDGTDCDDAESSVYPGAEEHCDGIDHDCDGLVDEPDAVDAATWCADSDSDGYGSPAVTTTACSAPSGYVADATDCDDAVGDVHPGAGEWCDGLDDDCDGVVDEDDALDATTFYQDGDGDGWGAVGTDRLACVAPSGYTAVVGDCDDAQALVHPGATETCGNGLDDDCDGTAGGCTPLGTIDLSGADARLLGVTTGDFAGCSLAGPGDFDGDGYDDLVLAARGTDSAAGSVHLFLGPVLGDVSIASADVSWYGEAAGYEAGWALAGHAEEGVLLVGAYAASVTGSLAGAAYLVTVGDPGEFSLADADARLLGEVSGDQAGYAVANAGDQDGDGASDWLVGAWAESTSGTGAGSAYLVSGTVTGDFLLGGAAACLRGEGTAEYAGWSVAGGADADGDGLADLLVGAPSHGWASTGSGAAYLLHGPISGDFSLAAADARLLGAAGDYLGHALDFVGDVDGDGLDDLLLGAYQADAAGADAGLAYLVLGAPSGDVALDSAAAARLLGVAEGDGAGWSVAGGGDVDGDGPPDLLVGAPYVRGSIVTSGAAYLVLGPVAGDLSLADADAVLYGESTGVVANQSVAMPGDVDADGWDDLFIGAPEADVTAADAGAAYLVFGGGM